jgi:hypothetical protein
MAIRIPILTSFDPKGLRQANAQFATLQSSIGSLGRNFAAAGAVIAGAGVLIGRSLRDAADSQRVFAQTEATLKSTGTTANGTAKQIANLAASLQKNTAFNDEAILSGQNLLLTFKGIQNQAGEGNDIFNQASATMLDFARAMNTGPSEAAIKLGKALQDPTRGVTALRKSGVDFTKDQMEMIKSLQESGDLMGAQKIVLAELQSQFGGSAAAYAKTFTGQLESMNNELNDLSEEIGLIVMPAVQGMITEFRELIPVIGPQLKAAIESVDWASLTKSVIDLTTFLLQNAQTIANLVIGIFALNTAYKLMTVASGLVSVALELNKWWLAQVTTGTTLATTATTIFSTALRLIPLVAIIAGLGLLVAAFTNTSEWAGKSASGVATFAGKLEYAGGKAAVLKTQLDNIPKEVTTTYTLIRQTAGQVASSFGGLSFDAKNDQFTASQITPTPKAGGSVAQAMSPLQQLLADPARNIKADKQAVKLEGAGLTKEVAKWITSVDKPVIAAREAMTKIEKKGSTAIAKLTRDYQNSSTGRAAAASVAAAADAAAIESANAVIAAQAAAVAAEAAALAERERVYKSFLDSVKNTFAGIKNAILGAFDLPQLGGSTNAITRNMEKLLVRLRAFADNVKNLASMGLNPALLQQVISAGPLGGARLAEALVMGGAGGLSALNAGYSEFGALSGQIAQTGTESLFNREAQQTVYNINVDGGVGSGSTIGKAIVDAIKAYERTSGAVWQGA